MQKKSVLFVTGKACDKLIDNLLFCTDVVAWSESTWVFIFTMGAL